jgi:hypothetical protein
VALSVRFVGLCLFARKEGALNVLLPATTGRPHLPVKPGHGAHAVPALHGAFLITNAVHGAGASPLGKHSHVYPLVNTMVRFAPMTGQPPISDLADLIHVGAFAKDVTVHADPATGSVAWMDLRGGTLRTGSQTPPGVSFTIDGVLGSSSSKSRVGHDVFWDVTEENDYRVELVHGRRPPETVELGPHAKIAIANLRYNDNGSWPNFDLEQCIGHEMPMADFVWYYRLLESSNGPLIKDRLGSNKAPIPVGHCSPVANAEGASIAAVTTETCFPLAYP